MSTADHLDAPRSGWDALARAWGGAPVPRALGRFWFALGAAPAMLLVVQLVTGVLLTLHYVPSPSAPLAYESVRRITEDVSFGWYLRSVHRFAATLMVATALLHQLRVLLTHSYLGPRRVNWVLGCGLLGLTMASATTGDGLSGEARGHWALVVGGKLLASVPGPGPPLSRLLLGGEGVSAHTLPRIYAWHAVGLPLALILLVGLHVALGRAQGSALLTPSFGAQTRAAARDDDELQALPFAAEQAWVDLTVAIGLLFALNVLSALAPATMGAMADPLVTPPNLKPMWFLLPAMSAVRHLPRAVALGAMGTVVASVLAWPYVVPRLARSARGRDVAALLAALGLLALAGLGLWEDLRAG